MSPKAVKLASAACCLAFALVSPVRQTHAQPMAPRPGLPARRLGATDPSLIIDAAVRLKMRDKDGFNAALAALYDPKSPSFRHWLSAAELAAYLPLPQQTASVRKALEQAGLTVVSVDASGLSIRARGKVADMERVFHTSLYTVTDGVRMGRAASGPGQLAGTAGTYVASVVGLESGVATPMIVRRLDPGSHKAVAAVQQVQAAGGLDGVLTSQALGAPDTVHFSFFGSATYTGRPFALNTGFSPHSLAHIYGMDEAYKQGLDGTGQTIVLMEAYGYPTAMADANAFSKIAGLPALTADNFSVIYPEGPPTDPSAGILTGWDGEIALDVQWAHAMAPGAKIVVVASPSGSDIDLQYCIQYIIDNHLGDVVSNSYEVNTEAGSSPVQQQSWDDLMALAAAKGISFDFSTGDSGDDSAPEYGIAASPLIPSTVPHATAIGGTSILNNTTAPGLITVGWGTVYTNLTNALGGVEVHPKAAFAFGGGGGESTYWAKPAWQSKLAGTGRQTPDISALADPFTGVPIVLTDPSTGQPQVEFGIGGTSLASPVFSAIWAIANQKAGYSLGQAAPTLAAMKSGIVDVVPRNDHATTSGVSRYDGSGPIPHDKVQLLSGTGYTLPSPLPPAALYAVYTIIGFSFDTSLTVQRGWDDVTGYGTPYGIEFLTAAEKAGR